MAGHPSHEDHRKIRREYGCEIERAKKDHWIAFLEGLSYVEVWTANQYILGDGSDGGKTHMPTLTLQPSDLAAEPEVATTNEEKSAMLMRLMFPVKPRGYSVPVKGYDDPLPSPPEITESQVRRHIVKLSPHKAPGANGIPNIVIKMSTDVIMLHLLQIFHTTIHLGIYAKQWKEVETCVLRKPGKPRYDIPKVY